MANYYTQFSKMIPALCRKQQKYIMQALNSAALILGFGDHTETGLEVETDTDGLWVHSCEGGVNILLEAVSEWQLKFKKKEPWFLDWANTCSKPRLDAFSGGAAVVYKGEIKYFNAYDELMGWVEIQEGLD